MGLPIVITTHLLQGWVEIPAAPPSLVTFDIPGRTARQLVDVNHLSTTQLMAVLFTVVLFIGIAIAYRPHGWTGVACISSQIASIIIVQLTVKSLMNAGFKYPMCIASIHFLCVTMSAIVWEVYQVRRGVKDKIILMFQNRDEYGKSARWYVTRVAPISALQCLNVVLNNASLMYLGAGLNALIGIFAPVLTAVVAYFFGARIAVMGWVGIGTAVLGDGILSHAGSQNLVANGSTVDTAVLGLCLGVCAMFARSTRAVMFDRLMNQYSKDENCPHLTPSEAVGFQSPLVFVFGLVLQFTFEGDVGLVELLSLSPYAYLMLVLSCAAAVYLTQMGMSLIKMLGASASQIAGKLNILVTVAISCAFLGERMSLQEAFGALVVLAGAGIFEKSHRHTKEMAALAQKAQKEPPVPRKLPGEAPGSPGSSRARATYTRFLSIFKRFRRFRGSGQPECFVEVSKP